MTDRYSGTPQKIADNETGASLETGGWGRDAAWNPLRYRPFADAEFIRLDAMHVASHYRHFDDSRAVRGFLLLRSPIELRLREASTRSLKPHSGIYSFSYLVSLIAEYLILTRPKIPTVQMTDLVCETDADYYLKLGEELYTTTDDIAKDERIKIIWSANWMSAKGSSPQGGLADG